MSDNMLEFPSNVDPRTAARLDKALDDLSKIAFNQDEMRITGQDIEIRVKHLEQQLQNAERVSELLNVEALSRQAQRIADLESYFIEVGGILARLNDRISKVERIQ